MKILICGHARHGKDTVARLLGIKHTSSSMCALDAVIWDAIGSSYHDKKQCFNDRVNRRAEWFKLTTEYNTPDKTRLARHIFASNDAYVGLRNREELLAVKEAGLVDLIIWVDRSEHLPPEGDESCTITPADCDIIFNNNGTLEEALQRAERLSAFLRIGDIQEMVTSWANSVFPNRKVSDAFNKMVFEEIPEFFAEPNAGELADMGILLYDVASLMGVDLNLAIHQKMAINRKRKWAISPITGVMKHVKGEQ